MSTCVTNYLSVAAYLALSDDERYEEVRRATIATMCDDFFNHYYKPTKNRWLDLARVWDKAHSCGKHIVLTSVIHKIYWGVHPYESDNPDFNYLLSLIEAELLDNREGFQTFNKWSVFKKVVDLIIYSTESLGNSGFGTHFIEHHHYLQARALCKLIFDKVPPPNYKVYVQEYQEYEEAVRLLIPDSVNWDLEQWGDDLCIADELKWLYCVDYAKSDEMQRNYERLIRMIRTKNSCCESCPDFLWYASNISELPLELAQVIWPTNLEDTVAKVLRDAFDLTVEYEKAGQPYSDRASHFHPVNHYTRSSLKASWLFKLAKQWFYEGMYSGEQYQQLKRVIFSLEMTV